MTRSLFVGALMFLCSCAASFWHAPDIVVDGGNPRPNIALVESDRPLWITIDPGVRNTWNIPADELRNDPPVTIAHWHDLLARGFENGFADIYKLSGGDGTWTIRVVEAEPFVAYDAAGEGYAVLIRYKAKLYSPDGKVVRVAAATVRSKWPETSMTSLVVDGIETMYEHLGRELFGDLSIVERSGSARSGVAVQ